MLKKNFAVFALLVAGIVLAGCNTVSGVGQDIQKAGNAIEGAAKKSK